MIREELKRPFLTDDDLSAFGEGCTKVMSDLGSYMYILTRPLGATNVKETLIDRHQWTDKFSATLESTSRASLSPDEVFPPPYVLNTFILAAPLQVAYLMRYSRMHNKCMLSSL